MSRVASASPVGDHDDHGHDHDHDHDDHEEHEHDHDHEHDGDEHEHDELQDDDGAAAAAAAAAAAVSEHGVVLHPHVAAHHAHHAHVLHAIAAAVPVDYAAVQNAALGTRKRVRLACSNCHKGKIKCDGERPCDRCLKKGLAPEECVDFQRKRTACTSCRAVKMKCDGNRPCKRCIKKGKGDECTDVDGPGTVSVSRRSREHRVGRADADDDGSRPVPYNYEDAAALSAAAAGYYYGAAPPWVYNPDGHGGWHPYMYHPAYAQAHAAAAAAAAGHAQADGEHAGRSGYPDMQVDPTLAGGEPGWDGVVQKNGDQDEEGEGEDGENQEDHGVEEEEEE